MIFQHTWQAVLNGTKTQTRRLCKLGEEPNHWHLDGSDDDRINEVVMPRKKPTPNGFMFLRSIYEVNKTYAVQPGRGQKAVGRIQITGIRQERVQDISEDDCIAEGCALRSWGSDYDWPQTAAYAELWNTIHTKPGTRWTENPLVWVLTFEAVRP